ncbi:unnamed protein product [Parnassius mnemosyne]|uniref:Uncharacterized protein n=1 Tax=Parnassius mnemosyne TaxID=213953 RepID=A0AAV1LZD3_9NEOP
MTLSILFKTMKTGSDAISGRMSSLAFLQMVTDYRRNRKRSKSKYRNRDELSLRKKDSTEDDSGDDVSKEYEKNPGNPYTVHHNRYKQNWMWNHVMTGDHMNVNPYAPQFGNYGPTAVDLFFGRKWWYFNQDDYKPFN